MLDRVWRHAKTRVPTQFKQVGARALDRRSAGVNLATFPDDVFLVSYPKSGNTWTRFLVANLLSDARATFENIERLIPDVHQNTNRALQQVPRPRMLKSHLAYQPSYRNVVLIVRDPRDIAVSYYHHQQKFHQIDDSLGIDQFTTQFLAGELDAYGPWGEHVGSWLGAREGREPFLLVRYEDMLSEPVRELTRVARHLELPADRARIERAVELSSVDEMKRLEREGGRAWKPLRDTRADKPFVRKGTQGGWVNELPDSCARAIETAWRREMTTLGYPLR